jgi:hypothetical protein
MLATCAALVAAAALATAPVAAYAAPQSHVSGGGVRVAALASGSEIINAATGGNGAPYCLDAQASGPLAGQAGDPVQLWHCNGQSNQYWHTYDGDQGTNEAALANNAWPNLCLVPANLLPGTRLYLESCLEGGPFEFWEVYSWENCVDDGGICPLYEAADGQSVLDAYSGDINNADHIQVWRPYSGRSDQRWEF